MTTRAQLYKDGLAAAVAAYNLKLLKEEKTRPPSALGAIAERSKSPAVKRKLEVVRCAAERANSKQVSKRFLQTWITHFRTMAAHMRHMVSEFETKGGARASQLRQIRALSAWMRRSELRIYKTKGRN